MSIKKGEGGRGINRLTQLKFLIHCFARREPFASAGETAEKEGEGGARDAALNFSGAYLLKGNKYCLSGQFHAPSGQFQLLARSLNLQKARAW